MKILWLCNIMLPLIAENLSVKPINTGGWLTGLSEDLSRSENIELTIVFPYTDSTSGSTEYYMYYGFKKSADSKHDFIEILKNENPDMVHIFGTEYKHTYDMVMACKELKLENKAVISIQGMTSAYCKHYFAALPNHAVTAYTLRDLIKRQNIKKAAKAFSTRGEYEIKSIENVSHIIGRTDWDKALTAQINPNAHYHFCNETLRSEFYKHSWNPDSCEKHSIFLSQCGYPIKGFHLMLEAMPSILKRYPDAHIYTTGKNPLNVTFKEKIKQTYYQRYIAKLIKQYSLENNVTFLGSLDEKQMCKRFLNSNIFVSASSIENSPNSVGEAMLLGVPTISSDVGGVKNMLTHEKDGFIYPYDEPYMIAYYVCQFFSDADLANRFSQNAQKHARQTHDRNNNLETTIRIYNEIGGKN